MFGPNQLVILAEILLSAYPLLIKLVDASLSVQTGLRLAVFTVLSLLWSDRSLLSLNWISLFLGALNLVHVFSSYLGFRLLAAGNATALFYIYPFLNLVGTWLVYGEQLPLDKVPWILLALLGALAIAQPTGSNWNILGVGAILVAALTEVAMYLAFKSKSSGPQTMTQMATMYGSSLLIFLILLFLLRPDSLPTSSWNWNLSLIVLFNIFVGFVGYALRFYMIPRVSTAVFSSLSFTGILSAYILGWLGAREIPNLTQLAGAIAIIIANIGTIQYNPI